MRRLLLATLLLGGFSQASTTPPRPLETLTSGLTFRNVGPFRTSAWVTDIAVPESPLRDHLSAPAKITVTDTAGKTLATFDGPAEAGFNRALWNMRPTPPAGLDENAARRFRFTATPLPPGDYRITIDVAGQTFTKVGTIRPRL